MEMKEYTESATLRAHNLNHVESNRKERAMVAGYEYNSIINRQRLFIEVPAALSIHYS